MDDNSSQQKTECQKPPSTVVMKPSSPALREQITSQLLQYVLFGKNPVKMVSVHETVTKSKFGNPGKVYLSKRFIYLFYHKQNHPFTDSKVTTTNR